MRTEEEKSKEKKLYDRLKALAVKTGTGHRVLLKLALDMFLAMTASVMICLLAVFISFIWMSIDYSRDIANVIYDDCARNVYKDELDEYFEKHLSGLPEEKARHYRQTQELMEEQAEASGLVNIWIVVLKDDKAYGIIDTDLDTSEGVPVDLDEFLPGSVPWADAIRSHDTPNYRSEEGWCMMVQGIWSMMVKRIETGNDTEAYVGLRVDKDWITDNLKRIIRVMFIMSAAVEGIVLILFLLAARKNITKPIGYLSLAAYDFTNRADSELSPGADPDSGGEGTLLDTDFFEGLPIHGRNEIGSLHKSLIKMEKEIKTYLIQRIRIVAENQRIETEFSVASSIQQGMLPAMTDEMEADGRYELHAMMRPAREVGGDFYDFFPVDDDHLALVIADVSDKGTPASMFMMMSKILIKETTKRGGSPAEILAYVNDRLCENNANCMFVTVWLGIVDLATGLVTASSAGHEYPFIKGESGKYEMMMDTHGMVLGAIPGLEYVDYSISLPHGGCIFVYTDGVTDSADPADERFETDRIGKTLEGCTGLGAKDTVETMKNAVDAFASGAEQFDDITMLAFKYN